MTLGTWRVAVAWAVLLAGSLVGCGTDPLSEAGQQSDPPLLLSDAGLGTAGDANVLSVYDAGLPSLTVNAPVTPSAGADSGKACGSVKQRSEPVRPVVDVVWVLDGSGSMGPHALAVADNMLRFMDGVRATGADINVVMLTGVIFGPVLQLAIADANYHWVPAEVQSHDAFRQAVAAYDGYKQFLRPGAPTHFIVVTDDSSDLPASQFLPMMMAKHGRSFYLHAVAADGNLLGGGTCPGSGAGSEYFSAAKATKGNEISLCADWAKNFEKLEGSVIASAPLPCEYAVPVAPNGEKLDPKAVQVLFTPSGGAAQEFAKATTAAQCGNFLGWYFDSGNSSAPKSVSLCPKACELVKRGGAIDLGFGCAPTIILD